MGAAVAHGEDFAVGAAPEDQGDIQEHRGGHLARPQRFRPQRRVPVVIEEGCRRTLYRDAGFGNGD